MIYILTGEINSGKTGALSGWVEVWRTQGCVLGGILAPARWQKGKKVSYDILDVKTGKRCLLASREPLENAELFGNFRFSKEALVFGENALLGLNAETEIGVVDEIGPLELENRGWAQGFRSVLSHPPQNLIVVVRSSLVNRVAKAFLLSSFEILTKLSYHPPVIVTGNKEERGKTL